MSVPSTTRTKPWWLGDVALRGGGLRARDQVMPLAVAADPRNRRGEHSPARIMGGHLLWLFWLNWVLECTSVFEVQASVMKEDADCDHDNYEDGDDDYDEDEALVVVRIGVSVFLMGVTDVWVRDWGRHCDGWFGESNRHVERLMKQKLVVPCIPSTCNRLLWLNGECSAGSEDWWVELWGDFLFVRCHRIVQGVNGVAVSLPRDCLCASFTAESISLSAVLPSEAVLLLTNNDRTITQLVVVDVAETYETKSLQVVNTTKCTLPPDDSICDCDGEHVLVMRGKPGNMVFIIEKTYNHLPVVLSVQSNGSVVKKLCDLQVLKEDDLGSVVWQVTESLFSVHNNVLNTIDLWDCNDMTAPKIRIEGVEVNSITGNGLVFFASGKSQSLCVMEPSSSGGTVVACVEFLSPGCQVTQLDELSIRCSWLL